MLKNFLASVYIKLGNFLKKRPKQKEVITEVVPKEYIPQTDWEKRNYGFRNALEAQYRLQENGMHTFENRPFGAFGRQEKFSTDGYEDFEILENIEKNYLNAKELHIAAASGELENRANELGITEENLLIQTIESLEGRNQKYPDGHYFKLSGLNAIMERPDIFIETAKIWFKRIDGPEHIDKKTGKKIKIKMYMPLDQIEGYSEVKV